MDNKQAKYYQLETSSIDDAGDGSIERRNVIAPEHTVLSLLSDKPAPFLLFFDDENQELIINSSLILSLERIYI